VAPGARLASADLSWSALPVRPGRRYARRSGSGQREHLPGVHPSALDRQLEVSRGSCGRPTEVVAGGDTPPGCPGGRGGDFEPVSYGFRPERRAHDAIAEIHHFGTKGYRRVPDADIEACFDSIDHTALMDRVRSRVKDKRVLRLVKAFLKAGIVTELDDFEDTDTGTPQGGTLSPMLANIALSVLDEHLHAPVP